MAQDKSLERIELLLQNIDEKLVSLNVRMKEVEYVAHEVKQNPAKIEALEKRVQILETCQASGKASENTLKVIWEIMNKPIVIAMMIAAWAYMRWGPP